MVHELSLSILELTTIYFIIINFMYGVLMLLSWRKVKKYNRQSTKVDSDQVPGVSFMIPAFNEQTLIVETIQTYLALPQPKKEIIVINDGSPDQTFKLLQVMYQLTKTDDPSGRLYRSITRPELKVIEAPHMGKAQALNFGTRFATFDIICTMDADTIPTERGVEACLQAFATTPKLIAVGGVIQVLSTQVLKNNSPLKSRAKEWLTSFQRLEYLRAFVCERLGWSFLGSTILISGAFCMLKKDALKKIGGFSARSITEDFDLIVRLRRQFPGRQHHIRILPITTCYTQVPRTLKHLSKQRMRWQLGLVQTLFQNGNLLIHPRHGLIGFFVIPYFWFVEALSPVVELLSYIFVPFAVYDGIISWKWAAIYFSLGLVYNVAMTLMGIYLDHKYVSKNKNWSIGLSLVETLLMNFGYRQINSWWRLLALMKSFSKATWGDNPRAEITHQT